MSFFSKRKRDRVAAPAQTCSRCHERAGVVEIHPIAPSAEWSAAKPLWLCDRCLDQIGRAAAPNNN